MASADPPKVKPVTKRNPNKPPEVKPVEILEVLTPDEKKRIKANRDPKATNSEDIMLDPRGLSKGGSVKSSASSRADGIAQRGKTRGRNC